MVLTYENNYNQAKLIKINIWIGESITECCIDNHQEHTTTDSTKWRLFPLKPFLDISSDNLKQREKINRLPLSNTHREPSWASQNESDSGKT